MTAPVEFTAKYATTVDTLPDAWVFVMDRIDAVGPRPSVKISPLSRCAVGSDEWTTHFEVSVSGISNRKVSPAFACCAPSPSDVASPNSVAKTARISMTWPGQPQMRSPKIG